MRSAETMRGIAAKFRKLAEEANQELAAHLLSLADEYDRMSRRFEPGDRHSAPRG